MSSLGLKVNVYLISKLDEVPERPGLYAWYLKLAKGKEMYNEFHSVMVHRILDVEASGELGEKYSGKMGRKDFEFEKKYRRRSNRENFRFENIFLTDEQVSMVTATFAPPIYIGISRNLHNRLREHKRELETSLNSINKNTNNEIPDFNSDSASESSAFGERIARVLRDKNYIGTNSLFIKTVEFDNIQKEELFDIEYFLNRTFTPIFGKK